MWEEIDYKVGVNWDLPPFRLDFLSDFTRQDSAEWFASLILMKVPKFLRLGARLAPTKRNLIFNPVFDL